MIAFPAEMHNAGGVMGATISILTTRAQIVHDIPAVDPAADTLTTIMASLEAAGYKLEDVVIAQISTVRDYTWRPYQYLSKAHNLAELAGLPHSDVRLDNYQT